MRTKSNFYDNMIMICIFIIILNISTALCFVKVRGESMEPVLKDGGMYLTYNIPTSKLEHNDILILKVDGERIVKLVKGKEGDTYQHLINEVEDYHYINYNPIIDRYPPFLEAVVGMAMEEKSLNKNEVFVVGANEGVSLDSRMFGIVEIGNISRLIKKGGINGKK